MRIGHKFAYSFYDFSAYKEFLAQGLGKGIFYIFLVTIIFSTLGNVRTVSVFNDDMSRLELKFNKESPDFEYKDGKLTMDYDGPIHYTYTGDSQFLDIFINGMLINNNLIVDTSGQTDVSALDSYKKGTYINSDTINIKTDDSTITSLPIKDYLNTSMLDSESIVFNKNLVKASFPLFAKIFDFTILFVNPILSFISNLCAGFIILGPLTIIISKNLNMKLSYKKACTISFYAMTMPLLIESLLTVSGLYIPDYGILFYAIALIYCSLALKSIKKSDENKGNKISALL